MERIEFRVVDAPLSDAALDNAMQDFHEEMLELGVDTSLAASGPAPAGARGTEFVDSTVAVMHVAQTAMETGMARAIAGRVLSWFARHRVGKLEVTIGNDRLMITNASTDEQEHLVKHFIAATSAKSPK